MKRGMSVGNLHFQQELSEAEEILLSDKDNSIPIWDMNGPIPINGVDVYPYPVDREDSLIMKLGNQINDGSPRWAKTLFIFRILWIIFRGSISRSRMADWISLSKTIPVSGVIRALEVQSLIGTEYTIPPTVLASVGRWDNATIQHYLATNEECYNIVDCMLAVNNIITNKIPEYLWDLSLYLASPEVGATKHTISDIERYQEMGDFRFLVFGEKDGKIDWHKVVANQEIISTGTTPWVFNSTKVGKIPYWVAWKLFFNRVPGEDCPFLEISSDLILGLKETGTLKHLIKMIKENPGINFHDAIGCAVGFIVYGGNFPNILKNNGGGEISTLIERRRENCGKFIRFLTEMASVITSPIWRYVGNRLIPGMSISSIERGIGRFFTHFYEIKSQSECIAVASYTNANSFTFPKNVEEFESFLTKKRLESYPNSEKNPDLAYEFARNDMPLEAYHEALTLKPKVKTSIPDVTIEEDGYIMSALEINSPMHLTIGNRVNCCQHINGVGKTCAIHAYTNEDGGTFIVKNGKGLIIAQSWVWRNGETLCFDNIETLSNVYTDKLASLYTKAANLLIGRLGITRVVVGSGYDDLGVSDYFKMSEIQVSTPDGCYTDSRNRQYLIAGGGVK